MQNGIQANSVHIVAQPANRYIVAFHYRDIIHRVSKKNIHSYYWL